MIVINFFSLAKYAILIWIFVFSCSFACSDYSRMVTRIGPSEPPLPPQQNGVISPQSKMCIDTTSTEYLNNEIINVFCEVIATHNR